MAGVYGEINSRADYFRVLHEAIKKSKELMGYAPDDPTLGAIDRELDAMLRWSSGGREPGEQERKSIDIGLRAVRELEGSGDPAFEAWVEKLYVLNSYFEDWPSDDEAANATDDDFWNRYG